MAEDEKSRLDRELIELLNELRVALPGVQVLFAFLLVVPFNQRFKDVTELERNVYFGAFLCTAMATALLIAPSAYHRLRWRQGDKQHMLETANRLTIAGTVFLALAIVGVVFLVTDFLFGVAAGVACAAVSAAIYAWFWYGLALARRAAD